MHKANRSNEINWPKIALAKYLPNAIFGLCEFFPVPKVALGKKPLYCVTTVFTTKFNASDVIMVMIEFGGFQISCIFGKIIVPKFEW